MRILDFRKPLEVFVFFALLTAIFFGTSLEDYFLSDDFVNIRYAAQDSFTSACWAHLRGGWLGETFVRFYRPFTFFVLRVSYEIFGVSPPGYHLLNFFLHTLNATLVVTLTRVLFPTIRPRLALVVGLLFLFHPAQPNAVTWIGATASLLSALFVQLSMLFFLRGVLLRNAFAIAGSLFCFVLALASYEQAVILPILLLSCLLLSRVRSAGRFFFMSMTLFGLVLCGYFALRYHMFSELLGGYPETSLRWQWSSASTLTFDFLLASSRLFFSTAEEWLPRVPLLLLRAVLGTMLLWFLARHRERRSTYLVLAMWFVVSQATFSFLQFQPSIGHFWYLSLLPFCILLVLALDFLGGAQFFALLGLVIIQAFLFSSVQSRYREAARLTKYMQQELIQQAERSPTTKTWLLRDYPFFLESTKYSARIAPLWNIGFADALRKPFVSKDVPVLPVEAYDSLVGLHPQLAVSPELKVLRWNGSSFSEEVPLESSAPVLSRDQLELQKPIGSGELARPLSFEFRILETAPGTKGYRLVLAAEFGSLTLLRPLPQNNEALIQLSLPWNFHFEEVFRFYDTKNAYWWIELLDADWKIVGYSELGQFSGMGTLHTERTRNFGFRHQR